MSDTDCGRLISVLAFYVFSCSCFHGPQTRKPSREARNESQLLWREEIETGPIPSFLRSNNPRQSSRGSSRVNSKNSRIGTPSSSKATSQFSLAVVPGAELRPLQSLVPHAEKQKRQRITTVTVSELPKIHPPINDRHPPVVSALPESKKATVWMTLPPPPARVMRAINRATHIRKTSQRSGNETPNMDTRLTGFEEGLEALSSPAEKAAVTLEEIEEKNSVRKRCDEGYRADSEDCSTGHITVVRDMTKGWLHDIPSPTLSTHSGAGYECHYFDPNYGAETICKLSYDQDFLYQTPSPSTSGIVGVIRRPPPVFKKPLQPSQNLDGFEDIYG